MSQISLTVSPEEQGAMERYAKKMGLSVPDAIKNRFFQSIEDEIDFQRIIAHRERKARGEVKFYTHDEIVKELGLEDDL